ncbi:MAG: hypothetical protein HDT46_03285 [Ruminococcaceae bacterium]|nr:hypothetical protein [Oscillospiraceae bacterium]
MKLSNKEKVILAIFLAIVIMAAGAFLIVVPEYQKIDGNRSSLEAAKSQRDQLYQTLTREATIDEEMKTAAANAETFANYFYDDMTTYEADALFREIIENGGVKTDTLNLGQFTTSTLTVSEYVETFVTYPLKEYSGYKDDAGLSAVDFGGLPLQFDEDGNVIETEELKAALGEVQDALKEYINTMLSLTSQTLGSISASFKITCTRQQYLDFLDYVHGLEHATYISGASVNFTNVGAVNIEENTNNNQPVYDEEGNEIPQQRPQQQQQQTTPEDTRVKDTDEFIYDINMTLYCAKALQTEVQTDAPAA